MKILHVLTLVTPDGSFGGPLRVALNQVRALTERGHDVRLLAGAQGYAGALPTEYDGVPVTLFPAHQAVPGTGFAGLVSPRLTAAARRWARGADVAHLHLARDLVQLPTGWAVRSSGTPYITHTHGMIDASDRLLSRPLDLLATRPLMHAAAGALALVEQERRELRELFPGGPDPVVLPNGVPATDLASAPERTEAPEVLFLARVAPRKRPVAFVEAAQHLARRHPDARFTLVGPDEGEGAAVRDRLAHDDAGGRITWEGALAPEHTAARMSRASVYVLPAVAEPFGMTVIEAMSVGLPTVVNHDCGLVPQVARTGGAVAADDSVDALVDAIDGLLADPARRAAVGAAGRALVAEQFSMEAVAARLEDVYERAITGGGRP